jgi:four helix bundle protein
MTTFKSYRDLEVWQKAMRLAKRIYQVTQKFPNDERFGLTNQLRRAVVSVPSNIAKAMRASVQANLVGSYRSQWGRLPKSRLRSY